MLLNVEAELVAGLVDESEPVPVPELVDEAEVAEPVPGLVDEVELAVLETTAVELRTAEGTPLSHV